MGEKAGKHGEGLSYSYIGRIESGQKNVSLVTLKRIAEVLDVSITQLFTDFEDHEYATLKDKQISDIIKVLSNQNEKQLAKLQAILEELVKHIE